MTRHTLMISGLGLASLALAPMSHAGATTAYNLVGTLPYLFTPSVAAGSPDSLLFTFGSSTGGTNFEPSKLVASNFVFDSNYKVDVLSTVLGSSGHYGYSLDNNNQISTVTVYDNGAPNTLSFSPPYTSSTDGDNKTTTPSQALLDLVFTSVGGPATFNLSYYDDPASTPFTLSEQYANQSGATVTNTLLTGSFNANGSFTPAGGSAGSTAVPEPSSLALLGLGVLPLLGVARRRAARA